MADIQPVPPYTSGPSEYYRRRIDSLIDRRLEDIETAQKEHSKALDKIETRVNYLFGALGILVVLANLGVPIIARALGL